MLIAAPEPVSIQLKWEHAFQFAGYYAAIEKGFYRDAGLEVKLKEIDFSKDYVEQVVSGESEYGISDSTLLVYHLQGKPVVLLNQFFQHSPLVFLSHRESGIISPYEMVGKTIAFNVKNKGDASLNALLINTLGDITKVHTIPVSKAYQQDFIDGKIDIISAYSTSQPYLFKEVGIEVNIINPQSYGIDYYGDNLFTSKKELAEHPERVEKMRLATIKGWQYALAHPDEIIQLIRKKYAPALSKAYLQYEAQTTRQMILPDLIEIGTIDPKRYQQAAEDYQRLGFTDSADIKNDFFYKQTENAQGDGSVKLTAQERAWLIAHPQVSFGGLSDWAPFDFVDQNGQYNGFSNDYLQLIAKKTGLKFTLLVDEWSKQLQKIKDKKIDLLASAYYTEERSKFVNYTTPYSEIVEYFFIRDGLNVKTLEDLNGKRVAIPKGYAQIKTIKKHFPKIKLVLVDGLEDAIDAVIQNQADMLYDGYTVLAYSLKKDGISNIIPFKSTRNIIRNSIHFISKKGAPELASIIQKGLDAITEKEKQAIYNKWVGAKPKTQGADKKIVLSKIEQQWLEQHKTIRFTGDPNWLPFEAFDKKGKYIGIVAEYLKLIEQKLGIKVDKILTQTWSESVEKVKQGKVDILSESTDSDLKSELTFTQSYVSSPIVIIMKNDAGYVESINQIKHQKIALIKDYGYVPTIVKKYPDIVFTEVNTIQEGLEAVSTGRIDAILATLAQASYQITDLAISNIKIVGKTEFNTQLAFGMSKEFAPLVPLFNRALNDISKEKRREINQRWIGDVSFEHAQKNINLTKQEQQSGYKLWLWAWTAVAFIIVLIITLLIITRRIPDNVLVQYFGSGGFRLPALFVVILIVVLMGMTINYTLQQNQRETLSQVRESLTVTLHSVVQQMDNWIEERFDFLQQLGQNSQLVDISERLLKVSANPDELKTSPELAELRQFFTQWEKKFGRTGFFVISPQMMNIASARDSNIGIRNLIAEQRPDLLKRAFNGEAVFIPPIVSDLNKDDPHVGDGCGQQCMSMFFAVPIRNSKNEVIAVLTQRLAFDSDLSTILRFGRIGTSGESYAFDETGLLASESRFREDFIKAGMLQPEQHEIGTIEIRDPGRNILQGYQPIKNKKQALTKMADALINLGQKGFGKHHSKIVSNIEGYNDYRGVPVFGVGLWDFELGIGITSEIDEEEALAGFYRLRTSLLAIAGILLLLFISAIVFTLTLASRAAQSMGRSRNELETLVENRTSELKQSKENLTIFRRFAETSKQGFGMAHLDTRVFYANKAMCDILGEPNQEAIYDSHLGSYYPAKIRQQIEQEILPIILKQGQWSGELIIKRRDGKRVPTFENFFLISDEQGKPLFIGDVVSDISQRKKAAEILAEAKEDAESANQAKSEFLANMSHEIRTPMNAIIGFAELLDEQIENPTHKSFVKTIRSAGHNLLTLINDILDLSKIEAGKFEIKKTASNPHEIFSELGTIFALKMEEKGLKFIMEIDPTIPKSLMLDSVRLRQVLLNLIGNAVKFTDKGFVRLKAYTHNEDKIRSKLDLLIDVEDSGIGISEDQIGKVFQEFEQTSGQNQRKYGGTGLGLSISQRLTALMGGKISLQSERGTGSTFTVTLYNVDVSALTAEVDKDSTLQTQIEFHPCSILIVDDVADNRALLLAFFADTEINITEAENGLEAVNFAKQQTFDLILMDIRMPVMDGYQAAKEIKAFSKVPIVALTASVMENQFKQSNRENFEAYLRKPVLKTVLINELCNFLAFDEVVKVEGKQQALILNDAELESLPTALEKLKVLIDQCKLASESNNMSINKQFVDAVIEVTKECPVSVMVEYAKQLNDAIQSFDIASIKTCLNDYPSLIVRLEELLKTD